MFFLVQGSIVSHVISIISAHIRAVAHPRVLRLKSYFVRFFSAEFNIFSAFFVHQPPTWPQKIDSREGLL